MRLLALGLLLALAGSPARADYLKASRTAIVHEEPATDSPEVARLDRGDLVDLASPDQREGYYRVTLAGGSSGWVYRTLVRRFVGNRPGRPANETGGAGHSPGLGTLDASAFAPSDCPPEGDTQLASLRELNRLKNRSIGPSPGSVAGVPLEDLLYPADDRTRWSTSRATEIVGFVHVVKAGGVETCNCGATAVDERDTHIEIVPAPDATDPDQRIIVEVTPTWRRFMRSSRGLDWSTSALKASILHKWMKVGGWMLFDAQHPHNATNTNPDSTQLWRATCWEIHPITALEVVPEPVQ